MISNHPPSLEARQLARLMDVSLTLNSTLNLEELLNTIIHAALDILDCEAASILLFDEKRNHLFFAASSGRDTQKIPQTPVPLEGSLAGTIYKEEKSIVLNDVQNDPRHYQTISAQTSFVPQSLLGVPMKIRDRGVGVLEALNKRNGFFGVDDERLLSVLASQAAVAIYNARLIQALQKAYEDINDADQLKSNFLALASHELRTPLGIIIGYASFLQKETGGNISEHAQQVLVAASQMRSLIDSMTSLHQLRDKGVTFRPRTIPIQQLLQPVIDQLRPLVQEKHQLLRTEFPAQPLLVVADPEKLAPAFSNIITNAIQFTPAGGKISIGTRLTNGNVLVWVRDTGVGLERDQLSKIFQEFYQVESHMTRQVGGLGIGLTIARGLIDSQGGKIWAESDGLGRGSTFKVFLPPTGSTANL